MSDRSLTRARRYAESLGTFEEVFSLDHLIRAAQVCKCGVAWKRTVQAFHLNLVANCEALHEELLVGTWRPKPGKSFEIHERGKVRSITACQFSDRVVQRCLCDHVLVPAIERVAIYDNAACLPGRGTSFALRRLEHHLLSHGARHGTDGAIFIYDFAHYFSSIDVDRSMKQFERIVFDERILAVLRLTLEYGGPGLSLGNQTAQLAAILYPNDVDLWVKDEIGVTGYGRYMDDGYALFGAKADAREFAYAFSERLEGLGLVLNPCKTRVAPVCDEFTFLKTRFRLAGPNRVYKRLCAEVWRRHRRHERALARLCERGVVECNDLLASRAAWHGTARRIDPM